MLSRLIFFLLLSIIYHLSSIIRADAFTMENQHLRLELPDVLGEKIIEEHSAKDESPRIVRGFKENIDSPFSLTVSSLLVDFGIISPTDPVVRTTNLLVQKGGATNGYNVVAFENHPLRQSSSEASPLRSEASPLRSLLNDEINDTSCDLGSCNNMLASTWTNPLVFGSGFRVDNIQGTSAYQAFEDKQNFMRLARLEATESAIPVMSRSREDEDKKNDEVRITHQVNISQTQPPAVYQNIIYYVAIPNF